MASSANPRLHKMLPFPSAQTRATIPPELWTACLNIWISQARYHLGQSTKSFQQDLAQEEHLLAFVTSYMHHMARAAKDSLFIQAADSKELRRNTFLLAHRALLDVSKPPSILLEWPFLSNVCKVYHQTDTLTQLLRSVHQKYREQIENSLQRTKSDIIDKLESAEEGNLRALKDMLPLLRTSSEAGTFMITGSDLLDSIISSYSRQNTASRSILVMFAYLSLASLLAGERSNHSLLLDHLYSIKQDADGAASSKNSKASFTSDLVTETPFLSKIRKHLTSSEATRAKSWLSVLEAQRKPYSSRPKKRPRQNANKGKQHAENEYGHGSFGDIHVHQMSLISQIQDLFPDLGSGFIVKLLDEYGDNVELVTVHLLEDTIPAHLRNLDRNNDIDHGKMQEMDHNHASGLVPRSTPPPSPSLERRNVFDNDEFDRLAVDASRLHIGRRDQQKTADKMLEHRGDPLSRKAAIMSALSAFDADDDEHDDTYDLEDVGGTVDSARPDGEPDANIDELQDGNEETLFRAWQMTPQLFERGSANRLGQARQALKSETGMTDEAIEGWAIMIRRDPPRLRRLEAKFAFSGRQKEIRSTGWKAEDSTDGDSANESGAHRGGFRGRGRGRGRGGNVAGPADDKGTQVSRHRKEANKGSRANHNRRDGRARKMARAGFPG